MEDIRKRIDELTAQLNEAARAYYDDASEIMTNYEYDELYDELLRLEAESGYVPEDSPSQNVGYTVFARKSPEFSAIYFSEFCSRSLALLMALIT